MLLQEKKNYLAAEQPLSSNLLFAFVRRVSLYLGSLEESHPSPNGQSEGEEVEGEAGPCVGGGRRRWRAMIAGRKASSLGPPRRADGTLEKQINRAAAAAAAEGCWEES